MRARVLAGALIALLAGFAQFGSVSASAGGPSAPTPRVVGTTLVDSRTDVAFVPHGADWPSFEYACSEGWGYSQDGDTAAAATAMASWGINTVRLPLNENCWLGSDPSDYGTAAGYRAAVNAWVSILNAHGMVVILDLHVTAPPGHHALGQYPMADSQSPTFWTSVAAAYASDPSIIFDAFNEPYSIWNTTTNSYSFQLTWDCWENGGCQAPLVTADQMPISGSGAGTYPVVGMSALVAAIRAGHAAQPIMLGGIDYSNNLTGWLSHVPIDSQLVASWHNYQGQSPCGDTAACWASETEAVAAQVPVVTGEFGETDGGSSFLTTFMTWADSKGIGYLPRAWWDAGGTSGDNALYALYSGPSFAPHAPSGTAYHAHLAALPPAPLTEVFRSLPAPMTISGFGTRSPPPAVAPTTTLSRISDSEIRLLILESQRDLLVARR